MVKRRLMIFLAIAIGGLSVAALLCIRFPYPGKVYRDRSGMYGLSEEVTILLRHGDCLVLSNSEEDVGRSDAAPGSHDRLSVIRAGPAVSSHKSDRGIYLEDAKTGHRAFPGDIVQGNIALRFPTNTQRRWFEQSIKGGWPIDRECGASVALILSINRAYSPAPYL